MWILAALARLRAKFRIRRTAPFAIRWVRSIDQYVKQYGLSWWCGSWEVLFLSFGASNCSFICWQSYRKYRLNIGMFPASVWNISQTIVLQKICENCFWPKILITGLQLSSVIRQLHIATNLQVCFEPAVYYKFWLESEQLVFIKCNKWNWHWQLLTLHYIGIW